MSCRLLKVLFLIAALHRLAWADAEILLHDGRVFRGTDIRRAGELYVLTLEDGNELEVPEQLVETVRLSGAGEERDEPAPGLRNEGPDVLAGRSDPEGPTGLRAAEPETLVGRPVSPPTPSEQLEALGPPARFRPDVVDNRWTPKSDWDMDPEGNNFNPATWSEGPVDPTWKPRSAWSRNRDVLEPGRSTWQKNVIDPSWTPTDGFRKN